MSPRRTRPSRDMDAFYSAREVTHVVPLGRRLSDYEAVLSRTQPDFTDPRVGMSCPYDLDGTEVYHEGSTALRHPDWFAYRDPSAMWQRTYVREQAAQEAALENLSTTARENRAFLDIDSRWAEVILARFYEGWACVEWGLFMSYARGIRDSLADTVSAAMTFAAVDHLRHQQAIAIASLDFDEFVLSYQQGRGRAAWLEDPAFQPARELVERLMVTDDWCETFLMISLVVEPLLSNFAISKFFRRAAPLHGDLITPVICMTAERDRARHRGAACALVGMLLDEVTRDGATVPARHNREIITGWIEDWLPPVQRAMEAFRTVYGLAPRPLDPDPALAAVTQEFRTTLDSLGLTVPVQ